MKPPFRFRPLIQEISHIYGNVGWTTPGDARGKCRSVSETSQKYLGHSAGWFSRARKITELLKNISVTDLLLNIDFRQSDGYSEPSSRNSHQMRIAAL